MSELSYCRLMESVCRQCATLYPDESWKWLADAEMWNHRAFQSPAIGSKGSGAAISAGLSVGEDGLSGEPSQRNVAKMRATANLSRVARRKKSSAKS